ncbi:MAG: hypothetical protein IT536_12655 [Hyphomicrobiales bacterium]|nr:hypothetical protein [Hyphomicrobiales bacterium]
MYAKTSFFTVAIAVAPILAGHPTSASSAGLRHHQHARVHAAQHRPIGRPSDPRAVHLPHCKVLRGPGGYSAVVCRATVDKIPRRL